MARPMTTEVPFLLSKQNFTAKIKDKFSEKNSS